jgi:hypothetical protein
MRVIEKIEPVKKVEDLKKGIFIPREIFELWHEVWDWIYHQLARSEFPDPLSELDEFQLSCICADPILWCQAFLREPEGPDHQNPYNFFAYQEESVRYPGHVIHEDGSEDGSMMFCLHKKYEK